MFYLLLWHVTALETTPWSCLIARPFGHSISRRKETLTAAKALVFRCCLKKNWEWQTRELQLHHWHASFSETFKLFIQFKMGMILVLIFHDFRLTRKGTYVEWNPFIHYSSANSRSTLEQNSGSDCRHRTQTIYHNLAKSHLQTVERY